MTRNPDELYDTSLREPLLSSILEGVMRFEYRGVLCNKSPFDLALYSLLLDRLQPRTIIEIGTKKGGSALWFRDMCYARGLQTDILTIDNKSQVELRESEITYIDGDAEDLSAALDEELLGSLRHPWMVVEDSAHTFNVSTSVLNFFAPRLNRGDYLIVEDGIVRAMANTFFARYEDGPSRAIAQFLEMHPDYEIDRSICDFFGTNVTFNPSGYLRKR